MMGMNINEFLADVVRVDIAQTLTHDTEVVGAPDPGGNRYVLHDAGNEDLLLSPHEMVDVSPAVAVQLPVVQRVPSGLQAGSTYARDVETDAKLIYTAREGINALAILCCRQAEREASNLEDDIRTLLTAAQQDEFGANDALNAATSRITNALASGITFSTEARTERSD